MGPPWLTDLGGGMCKAAVYASKDTANQQANQPA